MKQIELYLIRRNDGWGNYGKRELVMIEEDEDIYEELGKKYEIEGREDLHLSQREMVMLNFEIKQIDCDRLMSLSD